MMASFVPAAPQLVLMVFVVKIASVGKNISDRVLQFKNGSSM